MYLSTFKKQNIEMVNTPVEEEQMDSPFHLYANSPEEKLDQ